MWVFGRTASSGDVNASHFAQNSKLYPYLPPKRRVAHKKAQLFSDPNCGPLLLRANTWVFLFFFLKFDLFSERRIHLFIPTQRALQILHLDLDLPPCAERAAAATAAVQRWSKVVLRPREMQHFL